MPPKPLYISRLALTDIRCFAQLEIRFDENGASTVVIGDNGDGKSTILRSLAIGICDQSSASALFRELHGEFVRYDSGKDQGTIEVELAGPGRDRFLIKTVIKSLKAFERVEQQLFRLRSGRRSKLTQDEFPWERVFASGYGPGIRVQGMADYDYYLTVDAVYALFRYDVLLQNPELVVRRIIDAVPRKHGTKARDKALHEIKELLARVLQLDGPNSISLKWDGIYVKTSTGNVGLSSLSDGFRGTVTWVMDLIAWWFVYRRDWTSTQSNDIHGIVLIDEIEQHLHPRWQRNIMHLLTESFPHVQFIASTHSPLVTSGCEGIAVHRFSADEHSTEHPYGWLAEDVYRMMGLEQGSRPSSFRKLLDRVRELELKRISNRATTEELAELREYDQRLSLLPAADPVRTTISLKSIHEFLKQPARTQKKMREEADAKRQAQ